ncbi:TPA: hypothetical protein RQJ47_001269 [Vibrio vulnificus]|nr:hypothetical protein [Vibrio vulnificus]HDY7458341.1 hypothetical protein [Vibrio vulnificus]HDY7620379.1 hypothetical protein [Vibrio vulnificus]HDY8052221.1 hypothetical protein [Vibrio vulnificus]HDY8056888.1 hypothetical protein [Vibrio vulnificus]
MANLVNSIEKRVKKIFRIEDKVKNDIPLGSILCKIHDARYGDPFSVIAHAGGGTQSDGKSAKLYTNSVESVLDSINDGKKLIEIDLQVTKDNHIVALHSWSEFKSEVSYLNINRKVLHDESPLTLSEFTALRDSLDFKPMTLNEVYSIFKDDPSLILVIDKIKNLELLSEYISFKNRVVVEVFTTKEYDLAYSLGFHNVVMNIDVKKRGITDWVNNNKIKAVTLSAESVDTHPRAFANAKKLIDTGVVVLAYTSNNDEFIRNNIGITVSAVYTDYWSLKERSNKVIGGSVTY